MSEQPDKPKTIVTDHKVMHKIKYMQFRRQVLPIITVAVFLILNIFWPQRLLLYPTMAAFAWYIWERILWRTKNKILVPEEGAFVSPVNGKIQSVTREGNVSLITIRKSFLDVVEIRLPYTDLRMESNRNWFFDTIKGQIKLQIQSDRIAFFENRNITGDVIGALPGSSILTLQVPENIKILVKAEQPIFGGETVLFNLYEEAAEPVSILVEEPMDEIDTNEDV